MTAARRQAICESVAIDVVLGSEFATVIPLEATSGAEVQEEGIDAALLYC